MKQSIDFLICNYNGGDLLRKSIDSILNLNISNSYIYIYDNASSDDSLDSIQKFKSNHIKIIEGDCNIGYGKAINNIFDISKSEYIFILNPDAELGFDNIQFRDFIKNFEDKEIFGFNILNPDGTTQNFQAFEPNYKWIIGSLLRIGFPLAFEPLYKYYFSNSINKTTPDYAGKCVDFVSGCALFMKRISFHEIGKFNKQYFLYFEDTEFLHNAKRLGFCVKKSKLMIRHNSSYSFKNSTYLIKIEKYRSAFIYFNNTRGFYYCIFIKICVIFISILSLLNPINIFKRKLGLYFTNLILISIKN
jgi:GT2 family glycosyltransferase